MELMDLYRRTVDTWTHALDGVGPQHWDGPTPCTEWTVRDLVNHVVGEDAWTAPLMRGATIADVGESLDGDLLGGEPQAVARRSAHEAVAAVEQTFAEGGVVHLSYGDETQGEYLRQLAADHLVHSWDLAAAVGGETALDPELVNEVADWFGDREELYRGAGAIGPRVDHHAMDPQATLLAASGRDPLWTPATR